MRHTQRTVLQAARRLVFLVGVQNAVPEQTREEGFADVVVVLIRSGVASVVVVVVLLSSVVLTTATEEPSTSIAILLEVETRQSDLLIVPDDCDARLWEWREHIAAFTTSR